MLFPHSKQIDINNASYDMIIDIPFNDIQKKELIAEFMQTNGQINTIYDLLLIPDLTPSDINHLKTYIFIGSENSESIYSSIDNNSYEYGIYLG